MKKCNKCGAEKPATTEYFCADNRKKSGLRGDCKICLTEYNKTYRARNMVELSEKGKAYRSTNKSRKAKYDKVYYNENKVVIAEHRKVYWAKNKVRFAKRKAVYYIANKEYINRRTMQNALDNREGSIRRARKYQQSHLEETRLSCQRYRARRRALPATLTLGQWEILRKAFNGKCAYCGEDKPLTQDHFFPVSKGGEYTHNNIIPVCGTCNSSKGASSFFVWYRGQRFYNKKREKTILSYLGYKNNVQQLALM